MSLSASSPASFAYFHSLPAQNQRLLREVNRWRWVASLGLGLEPAMDCPVHAKWRAQEGNTHSPAHREIMLILEAEGRAFYSLQDQIIERKTGTVFLFDHHEMRDWKHAPHNKGHHTSLWLHFPVAFKDSLTYNTVTRSRSGHVFREISQRIYSGEAARLIPRAWDQCRQHPEEAMHWELLKAHVSALLLEILSTAEAKQPPHHHANVIAYICRYIKEHYRENLALQKLADLAGYSPYFFHRIFHRQTGVTPKEYLDQIRLHRAMELLKTGHKVSAIAEEIGMQSPFTFSRFFKHHTRCSPTQWRELNTGVISSPGLY